MPVCTGVSQNDSAGAMLGSRNGVQLRFQKFLRSPPLCKIREIIHCSRLALGDMPYSYTGDTHSFIHIF
eukprot:COSAG01_NODE_3309_length_6283_cov_5.946798_2_plen_69_part_00